MSDDARSLSGRGIVLTRPRRQNTDLSRHLEDLGANVIVFPVTKITSAEDPVPFRDALTHLLDYAWIIFTSTNTVDSVAQILGDQCATQLKNVQVGVVGGATAQHLEQLGVRVDFVPQQFTFAQLCRELIAQHNLDGKRILYPGSNLVRSDQADALREVGARVDVVEAYRTIPDDSADLEDLRRQLAEHAVDTVVFASPSAVNGFFTRLKPAEIPANLGLISIGPRTTTALQDAVSNPIHQARQASADGLIEMICDLLA